LSSLANAKARAHPRPLLLAFVLAGVVLAWSFNFIAGKVALRHLNPLALASLRIELAALILLFLYLSRSQATRFQARDFWTFAVLGFFGVVMNSGLFTIGLAFTTAGHSSIICGWGPLLVLLLARTQGLESLTFGKLGGMALSSIGVVILATEKGLAFHSPELVGDVITLVGSTGFALYTVFAKKVAARYDSLSMNTFNNVAGAILLLPLAIYEGIRLDWHSVGWAGWIGLLYMAAIISVASYLLYYWALRHMSASRLAAISYFEPVLVVILGILFLGEHLTRSLLVGGALVLIGVYITERSRG
jgi:drug/metabolite transporter (DMT)-like permease